MGADRVSRGIASVLCLLLVAAVVPAAVANIGPTTTEIVEREPTAFTPLPIQYTPPGIWAPNVILTNGTLCCNTQTEPHIAVNKKGQIVAGWKEAADNVGGGQQVGTTYSHDGGATWGVAKDVDGGSDIVFAVDENDAIYLSRLGGCGSASNGICHHKSTDGGITWGTPVLSSFQSRGGLHDKNWVASDGKGTLYMAYEPKDTTRVQGTVSKDGGVTWGDWTGAQQDIVIADGTSSIGGPYIIGDRIKGGAMAAFIRGGTIYFDRTAATGNWGSDVSVGQGSTSGGTYKGLALPSMAHDSTGRIFVAYPGDVSGRGKDIVVKTSIDDGKTWSSAVSVNDDSGSADQWQVQGMMAVDSTDRVHAGWRDERSGQMEMYYSNSTDGGKTWSPNIKISDAPTPMSITRPGEYNGLAVGPNDTLYAAWADGRPDGNSYQDIYFSKMNQGGGGGNNSAPAAPNVAGPLEGFTNTSYSYNSSSSDPDNDQVKITIDWGDGKTDVSSLVNSGQNVQLSHQWSAKGTYAVKGMSTDVKGATSAWGPTIQVVIDWKGGAQNNAPLAPTLAGPSTGLTSQSLSFAVQGTDPDNDQVKYTVEWGDTRTDTGALVASGTLSSFSHAWTAAGTYTAKAMSTDAKGATSLWSPTLTVVITDPVGNNAPAAPTVAGPLSVLVGAAKQYSVVGTDPDNDQVKYTVDWGDTNSETGALTASGTATAFTHSWTATGSYQVKAKSTDDKGVASGWGAVITVAVTDIPDDQPPVIQHTPKQEADAGKAIDIEATITDDVGVVNADLYYKPDGASSFTRLAMYAPGPSTIYKAIIPATDVKGAELKYYIEASDAAANKASDPSAGESAPHVIKIRASPGGQVEGSFLSSPIGLLLLLVIAVVIAALVAVMLMRRRKKDPAASYASAAPYGAPPAGPPQYQQPTSEQPLYQPPPPQF